MNSIGKENAIKLADSNWWIDKTPKEIVDVQLFTSELCMPFDKFHEAIEKVLDRSVYIHEFGMNYEGIVKEYLGERQAPTIEEIVNMIPAEKRIIVNISKEN